MSITSADWRRLARAGAFMTLWAVALLFAAVVVRADIHRGWMGIDVHPYWLAGRSDAPYSLAAPGHEDAFEYSPLFAQAMRPLSLLPFKVLYPLWSLAEFGIFSWMTRRVPWRWRVPILLGCVPELCLANINAFLGLVVIFGLTRPTLWAFPALTKIVPTGVGAAWFLARGDIRAILRGLVVTVALIGVSYLLEPTLWHEWFAYLKTNSGKQLPDRGWHYASTQVEIAVRLLIAMVAAALLARRDIRWPMPFLVVLATPVFGFTATQILPMVPAAACLAWDRTPAPTSRARSARRPLQIKMRSIGQPHRGE